MTLLDRYINRLFIVRFAMLLAGLGSLVTAIDLLANFDDIIADGGGISLVRYGALRLPDIVARLLPFCVLIAALLTLTGLVLHREFVIIAGSGISQFRMMVAFLPTIAVAALGQFYLVDQLVPVTSRALHAWGLGEYGAGSDDGESAVTWARDRQTVVRVRRMDSEANTLHGVTIFHRDSDGALTERIDAATARRENGAWMLRDAVRITIPDGIVTRLPRLRWNGKLRIADMETLSLHPRELTLRELQARLALASFGNRPRYVYETWRDKRVATPLKTVLMLLFAVPLVQRFQRDRGAGLTLAIGVASGFVFFVFDEFLLSIGEAGLLPPAVSAWAPMAMFACLAGATAFHVERP